MSRRASQIHNKRIFGIRLSYMIAIIVALSVIAIVAYHYYSNPYDDYIPEADCAALRLRYCAEWRDKSWLIPPVDTKWNENCGMEPVEEECRDFFNE